MIEFENESYRISNKFSENKQDLNLNPTNPWTVIKGETKLVSTFLKAAESVEMTDQDVEFGENHGTEFKHDSLMDYSNVQLDFIKVFGQKVFVMVISKLYL